MDSQEANLKPPKSRFSAQDNPNRKLLIILHGKRAGDESFEQEVRNLQNEGHQVKVRVTYGPGDVDEFVRDALAHEERPETFVAAGGDGTLNELVGALIKHGAGEDVSVGLVPFGTSNDFAAAAGISQNPMEALKLAADPSKINRIDVGLVNGQVFMNTAGVGCSQSAEPGEGASKLKQLLGPLAIVVHSISKFARSGVQPHANVVLRVPLKEEASYSKHKHSGSDSTGAATADQQILQDQDLVSGGGVSSSGGGNGGGRRMKEIRGDLLLMIAGNNRQLARTINACPDALLDDGMLDFTMLMGSAGQQLSDIIGDVLANGITNATGRVKMMRAPWIEVESEEDMQINRDGEPTRGAKKVRFEVLPGRLGMHLPDDRLLLAGAAKHNTAHISLRKMRAGKLRDMLFAVKTAPGRWSRIKPKAFRVLKVLPVLGLVYALGVVTGVHRAGANSGEQD